MRIAAIVQTWWERVQLCLKQILQSLVVEGDSLSFHNITMTRQKDKLKSKSGRWGILGSVSKIDCLDNFKFYNNAYHCYYKELETQSFYVYFNSVVLKNSFKYKYKETNNAHICLFISNLTHSTNFIDF